MADRGAIEDWPPRLVIIRLQRRLSRVVGIRIVSSVCLMFLPVMAVAVYLQVQTGSPVLSRGVVTALAWLAVAPWLIEDAVRLTHDLLREYRPFFVDDEEWNRFAERQVRRLESSSYLYFGLPWAAAVTAVILLVVFPGAPPAVQIWAGISFLLLFLTSAIGFRGTLVLISIVQELCKSDIRFVPHHPDRFGGMNGMGSYAVRGALYFSSGAMVFPLVFEVINKLGTAGGLMELAVFGLVAVFIGFTIAAFLVPTSAIKEFVGAEKTRVLLQSSDKLDSLIARFEEAERFDAKTAGEIVCHYFLRHSEFNQIKDYPYDARVLVELTVSVLIPIAVVTIELVLR